MKMGTFSASALDQNGSNRGDDNSSPLMVAPTDPPLRPRRTAELGELFILELNELLCDLARRRVPRRIDAQRFNVDALLVHLPQTARAHHQRRIVGGRLTGDFSGARDNAVGVDIDRLDSPASHAHFPAARGWR
jgi:hypothetical protein